MVGTQKVILKEGHYEPVGEIKYGPKEVLKFNCIDCKFRSEDLLDFIPADHIDEFNQQFQARQAAALAEARTLEL